MIKFYYFKVNDYIVRVFPSYYCEIAHWAMGVSATKKEITNVFYYPQGLWDKATKKDWYKAIRRCNEKG